MCGSLMADEISGTHYRDKGFGYAYEVLCHDGIRFEYVSNLLYVRIDCHFKKGELVSAHVYDTVYRYLHNRNVSFLMNFNLKNRTKNCRVIEPVFGDDGYRKLTFGIPISMRSANYFTFFSFRNDENPGAFAGSFFFEEGMTDAPSRIEREKGKEYIALNRKFINFAYSVMNKNKSSNELRWR